MFQDSRKALISTETSRQTRGARSSLLSAGTCLINHRAKPQRSGLVLRCLFNCWVQDRAVLTQEGGGGEKTNSNYGWGENTDMDAFLQTLRAENLWPCPSGDVKNQYPINYSSREGPPPPGREPPVWQRAENPHTF